MSHRSSCYCPAHARDSTGSLWLPVAPPCDFCFFVGLCLHIPHFLWPHGGHSTWLPPWTSGCSPNIPDFSLFYCFLVGHFLCCPTPYLADTEDWKYPPLHGPHYSVIKVYIYLKQLLLFDLLAKTGIAQQSNCPFNHCSCPRLWDP